MRAQHGPDFMRFVRVHVNPPVAQGVGACGLSMVPRTYRVSEISCDFMRVRVSTPVAQEAGAAWQLT